jgi:hypothetical protein
LNHDQSEWPRIITDIELERNVKVSLR